MGLLFTHVLNSWAAQDPFSLHELFNRPLDQRSDYSIRRLYREPASYSSELVYYGTVL